MCAVPVAVPTGKYDVTCVIDLNPLFGVVTKKTTVELVSPGPEAVDKRLEELKSEDKEVRQTALFDLIWFPEAKERIFPELLKLLDDPDGRFRGMVISVMGRFPHEAAKHVDRFIEIALDEKRDVSERGSAAWFLAQYAPASETVEKCLEKLSESKDPKEKQYFQWPIQNYRNRVRNTKTAPK
jgi:hypothetical protein